VKTSLRGMLLWPWCDFGGRQRGTGSSLSSPTFPSKTTMTPPFTPLLVATSNSSGYQHRAAESGIAKGSSKRGGTLSHREVG